MNKVGNSFQIKDPDYRKVWRLYFPIMAALYVGCMVAEYLVLKSYYIIIPGFFLLLYGIYRGLKSAEDRRDKMILEYVENILTNDRIEKFIKQQFSDDEVNLQGNPVFSFDVIGYYGAIDGYYYLILLSNGEVFEYDIQIERIDSRTCEFSIPKDPILCTNEHRLAKIVKEKKQPLKQFLIKHIKVVLLLGFLLFGGILTALFVATFFLSKYLFFLLIFVIFLFVPLASKIKNKAFSKFLIFIYAWVHLEILFCTFLFAFLSCIVVSCFIPYTVLFGLSRAQISPLSSPTNMFIALSLGAIFATYFPDKIRYTVFKSGPLYDMYDHAYKMYMSQLVEKLLDSSVINMLICLLYFIVLTVVSAHYLQCHAPLISSEFEYSLIHSFMVYIAFSGFMNAKQKMQLDIDEIFSLSVKVLTAADDDKEFIERNKREPLN
jgi:hypothetical protein